jgi:hypothetical protein
MGSFPPASSNGCPDCGAEDELPSGARGAPDASGGRPREPEPEGYPTAEFGPQHGLEVRAGRPALDTSRLRWTRFCVLLLHPIVCLWLSLRQRRLESLVNRKLDEVTRCHSRQQLRQVIGEPLYAVSGQVARGAPEGVPRPLADVIECYESDGCCIDLWFRHQRLVSLSGFVKPTVWDIALAGRTERA